MNHRRRLLIHSGTVLLLAGAATWITAPAAPAHRQMELPAGSRRVTTSPRTAATTPPTADEVLPAPEAQEAVQLFRAAGGSATITDDGQVRALNLTGATVTDDDLQHLAQLPRLTLLNLDATAVTDDGLQHVRDLPELSILRLCRTPITDAGLQRLENLPALSSLVLDDTAVTDAGIAPLVRFPSLHSITVMGCPVTDRAQHDIREHLPNCRVKR